METFLWSLLLAAISAVTFVAYKHPLAFRKRVGPFLLFVIVAAACFVSGIFAGGVEALSAALLEHANSASKNQEMIQFIANELVGNTSTYYRSLTICGVTFVYVLLLVFLPLILGISVKEDATATNSDGA